MISCTAFLHVFDFSRPTARTYLRFQAEWVDCPLRSNHPAEGPAASDADSQLFQFSLQSGTGRVILSDRRRLSRAEHDQGGAERGIGTDSSTTPSIACVLIQIGRVSPPQGSGVAVAANSAAIDRVRGVSSVQIVRLLHTKRSQIAAGSRPKPRYRQELPSRSGPHGLGKTWKMECTPWPMGLKMRFSHSPARIACGLPTR